MHDVEELRNKLLILSVPPVPHQQAEQGLVMPVLPAPINTSRQLVAHALVAHAPVQPRLNEALIFRRVGEEHTARVQLPLFEELGRCAVDGLAEVFVGVEVWKKKAAFSFGCAQQRRDVAPEKRTRVQVANHSVGWGCPHCLQDYVGLPAPEMVASLGSAHLGGQRVVKRGGE